MTGTLTFVIIPCQSASSASNPGVAAAADAAYLHNNGSSVGAASAHQQRQQLQHQGLADGGEMQEEVVSTLCIFFVLH